MNDQHSETEEIARQVDHIKESGQISTTFIGRPEDVAKLISELAGVDRQDRPLSESGIEYALRTSDILEHVFRMVGIDETNPGTYKPKVLFDRLEELTQPKQEGTLTEAQWRKRQNKLLEDVKEAYSREEIARNAVKDLLSKVENLQGEIRHLETERDDAIHVQNALEESLRKALARQQELESELETARSPTPVFKSDKINTKVIRTLCEMLDVSPSTIPLRVRRLLVAEKRLNAFRGPDGKLPYPTTKAEREKIRQRPFKARKVAV
jgi:hypothetical protein